MFKFVIILAIFSPAVSWNCYDKTDELPTRREQVSLSVIHGAPRNMPLLLFLNLTTFLGEGFNSPHDNALETKNLTRLMQLIKENSRALEDDFKVKFRCLNAEQRARALGNYMEVIDEEYAAVFPSNFEQLMKVVPYFFRGLSRHHKRHLMKRNVRLEAKDEVYYKVILGLHTKEIKEAFERRIAFLERSPSYSSSSGEDEDN